MFARLWNALLADRSGGTAIEYGLVMALITIGLFAVLSGMGNQVRTTMTTANTTLSTANAAG
jgi:pilus assembly protein Flp/PilA